MPFAWRFADAENSGVMSFAMVGKERSPRLHQKQHQDIWTWLCWEILLERVSWADVEEEVVGRELGTYRENKLGW
jgi:hypothetical protein